MQIEINKIFTITKGNRQARWKVIESDYFDNAFALVRDYSGLYGRMSNTVRKEDKDHTCGVALSLEQAYEMAYNHT